MGASAAGGYEIDNSLRFNDDDSAYLSRTPSVAGNHKTWTWSGWVKRGNLAGGILISSDPSSSGNETVLRFRSEDIELYNYVSNAYDTRLISSAVFRDSSAWYHVVATFDSVSVGAKLYVNGIEISLSTNDQPAANADSFINTTNQHTIGKSSFASSNYLDGYLAEVNFIDGLALTPDSFGETGDYGEWKPLRYTGAYGTNGFYLDFADSGNLGKDLSINANNWTPTNLAATDQMVDSPTNNFCTLNVLNKNADVTLSEGNLKLATTLSNIGVSSTYTRDSSKFYFEVVRTNVDGSPSFGVASPSWALTYAGVDAGVGLHSNGIIYKGGAQVQTGLTSVVNGDIVGVACDFDANSVSFYINNTQVGTTVTGITGEYSPAISGQASTNLVANFGQDSSFAGNKTAQGNSDSNGIGDF